MANFNKVMILGNLTRDPEQRFLPSQQAVTNFSLAVNRKFKTQSGEEREEVTFIDCEAWGKQAEIINKYCQRGRPLFIEGRLKQDSWDDKTTGQKRTKMKVVVENFQLLGGRDNAPGGGGGGGGEYGGDDMGQAPAPPRQQSRPPANRPASQRPAPQAPPQDDPPFSDEAQFKDDDIPF